MPQSSMNPTVYDWYKFRELIREALKRHGAFGKNRALLTPVSEVTISFNAETAMLVASHGWGLPKGWQVPLVRLAENDFLRGVSQRVWTDKPQIRGGRFHIRRFGVVWAGRRYDYQVMFEGVSRTTDPLAFESYLDDYRNRRGVEAMWADSVQSLLGRACESGFQIF